MWAYSYFQIKLFLCFHLKKCNFISAKSRWFKEKIFASNRARYLNDEWLFIENLHPIISKGCRRGYMKPDPKPGGKAHKVIWGGTLTSFSNNYKYRWRKRTHWFSFYFENEVIDAGVPWPFLLQNLEHRPPLPLPWNFVTKSWLCAWIRWRVLLVNSKIEILIFFL